MKSLQTDEQTDGQRAKDGLANSSGELKSETFIYIIAVDKLKNDMSIMSQVKTNKTNFHQPK